MPVPQFLLDLLQLLFDLAVPGAFCTLTLAGLSLRQEGGTNFHVSGRTAKWIFITMLLLTLPQGMQWIAAQGINVPQGNGAIGTSWLSSMETIFTNFVSQVLVGKLVPVIAAYFVLKATLDAAAGENPLPSIICAMFLMSLSTTMQLFQSWKTGDPMDLTNMLTQLWNYIVGSILPAAAALASIGAVICYVRHRPFVRYVLCAIGFFTVTGLLALFRSMAAGA